MGVRLSPKRFIAIVSALLTFYSLARVAVLFFEALAVVREGRSEDYELIELCQRGDARGSAKMREACLKARADLASPLVFKAIVQAVSVAFKDFSDTVGSPFKFGVVVLFVVSSVMLPIMPWVKAIFGQSTVDFQPMNGVHYISYAPPPDQRSRLRRGASKVMKRLKLARSSPTIEEVDEDGAYSELEPGLSAQPGSSGQGTSNGKGWVELDIGKFADGNWFGGRPASPSAHHKYD